MYQSQVIIKKTPKKESNLSSLPYTSDVNDDN